MGVRDRCVAPVVGVGAGDGLVGVPGVAVKSSSDSSPLASGMSSAVLSPATSIPGVGVVAGVGLVVVVGVAVKSSSASSTMAGGISSAAGLSPATTSSS